MAAAPARCASEASAGHPVPSRAIPSVRRVCSTPAAADSSATRTAAIAKRRRRTAASSTRRARHRLTAAATPACSATTASVTTAPRVASRARAAQEVSRAVAVSRVQAACARPCRPAERRERVARRRHRAATRSRAPRAAASFRPRVVRRDKRVEAPRSAATGCRARTPFANRPARARATRARRRARVVRRLRTATEARAKRRAPAREQWLLHRMTAAQASRCKAACAPQCRAVLAAERRARRVRLLVARAPRSAARRRALRLQRVRPPARATDFEPNVRATAVLAPRSTDKACVALRRRALLQAKCARAERRVAQPLQTVERLPPANCGRAAPLACLKVEPRRHQPIAARASFAMHKVSARPRAPRMASRAARRRSVARTSATARAARRVFRVEPIVEVRRRRVVRTLRCARRRRRISWRAAERPALRGAERRARPQIAARAW